MHPIQQKLISKMEQKEKKLKIREQDDEGVDLNSLASSRVAIHGYNCL